MSYASRAGRAYTDPSNPRAFGVCGRCGIWHNRHSLRNQLEYRGSGLLPLNIWVCTTCLDTPQAQLKAFAVAPDPVPIYWPLPEAFVSDETDANPVIGAPAGLDFNAVMPQFGSQAYGQSIPVLSVTANGTTTISVTCSSAHRLATDAQIAVQGLANPNACGFFSVTVSTATAFSYATLNAVASGALWQPSSRMITALVGLPYNTTQIPQV